MTAAKTDANATNEYAPIKLFSDIQKILHKDGDDAFKALKVDDSQFNRRNFTRVTFALIEGLTFGLKSWALASPGENFSPAELILLSEVTYELKENGTLRETSPRLRTLPNIRFAFAAVSRVEKIENPLDASSAGWNALEQAIRIRHNLTHPKSPEKLTVSDADIKIVTEAYNFFLHRVQETFNRSISRLEQENARLRAIAALQTIEISPDS